MHKVHYSSLSVDWATPKGIYDALDKEFHFDNDPNPLGTIELVGLVPWGTRNFCNPPYGRGLYKWVELGYRNPLTVMLLPARTDTRWFHDIVLPYATEVRFIKGRLKFGDATNYAPFPSMVVIFKE